MTNPKIEKVKTAIEKTKGIIADYQTKLRDLERQKVKLENDEIVALFRREKFNEDEFAALLRSGRDTQPNDNSNITSRTFENALGTGGAYNAANINPSSIPFDGTREGENM